MNRHVLCVLVVLQVGVDASTPRRGPVASLVQPSWGDPNLAAGSCRTRAGAGTGCSACSMAGGAASDYLQRPLFARSRHPPSAAPLPAHEQSTKAMANGQGRMVPMLEPVSVSPLLVLPLPAPSQWQPPPNRCRCVDVPETG